MQGPSHRFTLAALTGLAALAAVALPSCRDDATRQRQEPPPAPACNDGRLDPGEECDGSDLGGQSCSGLGFDTGSLSCGADCRFSTVACVKRCGNGALDLGEECDGSLGPLACSSFGYKECSLACRVEAGHCVTDPFAAGPALSLEKGGATALADISPKGFGDLVVAVPNFLRLETFPYTVGGGFLPGRKVSSAGEPLQPIAADLDGDGETDLASINADGLVQRYRYTQNTFPAESYPSVDGGANCPASSWVGAGQLDLDGAADLVAESCPTANPARAGALLVFRGGTTPQPPLQLTLPGLVAAALGDADGDGLTDLLLVDESAAELQVLRSTPPGFTAAPPLPMPSTPSAFAAGDLDGDGDLDLLAMGTVLVEVLENTGTGFASRQALTAAAPVAPKVLDLDLDGRPDLLWLEGDRLKLRRNAGSFLFTAYELSAGQGAPLSLSSGDLDGDGDPDLVVTRSQGGAATVSYALLNKVR